MSRSTDLVQGTVDLLILKIVASEPRHGWSIAQRLQHLSNDVLKLNQSALYPALHRLEKHGWLRAQWRTSENGRRAKYYAVTKAGARRLEKELQSWRRLSSAIALVTELG